MPLNETPAKATNFAEFTGTKGKAAEIDYNVPLPNSHKMRRSSPLDLGLADGDWTKAAKDGTLKEEVGLTPVPNSGGFNVDEGRAVDFFRSRMHPLTVGPTPDPAVVAAAAGVPQAITAAGVVPGREPSPGTPLGLKPIPDPDVIPPHILGLLEALKQGRLVTPIKKWGGGVTTVSQPADPPATPQIFLVEVLGISSFLDDYGLGRTVRTYSLLPGEQTTISLRTWRSDERREAQGSSIVDSFQESATNRFMDAVQDELGSQVNSSESSQWNAGGGAGINLFGLIQIGGGGGGGGEDHTSRSDFAKHVSNAMTEHINESNAARESVVTSSTERTAASGDETLTERTIRNVNLRRTLNFVFRELNQEYVTKLHLTDIRVGFSNGKPGTWREVSLSQLRPFLTELVNPAKVDEITQKILKLAATVFDHTDKPVRVLESLEFDEAKQELKAISLAKRGTGGNYPAPSENLVYRFRRGELEQKGAENHVQGVVLKEQTVVLRTDSVIVEALLGQADALDQYALITQKADAESRALQNTREEIAHDALRKIADGNKRAGAFAEMFREEDALHVALDQNGA